MFSTLESNWDLTARRRWAALISFTVQALGLSLLVAISLIWVEGPTRVRWLQLSAPAAFTPVAATQDARGHHTTGAVSSQSRQSVFTPPSIPPQIAAVDETDTVSAAPELPNIASGQGRRSSDDVAHSMGEGISVVIPTRPAVVKPLLVSHLAEANLLHRVQPIYPPIARQAGIHGAVELRAIISKAGTIENLIVVSGHPMLVRSAIEAVRQWRYRPYLLNSEPIEVETEITVNFVLSGS
jgi:periplasmic protein TonB